MLLAISLVLAAAPTCDALAIDAYKAYAARELTGELPPLFKKFADAGPRLKKGWAAQCEAFSAEARACAAGVDRDKELAKLREELVRQKVPPGEIEPMLAKVRAQWSILDCAEVQKAFDRAGAIIAGETQITVELELGERTTVHVPGIQRIAVSGSVVDVKTIGNDQVMLIGIQLGRSTAFVWTSSGGRISINSHVVENRVRGTSAVPATTRQDPSGVTVVEIPEGLRDLHEERAADGGLQLVGLNDQGLKIFIRIEPMKRRDGGR